MTQHKINYKLLLDNVNGLLSLLEFHKKNKDSVLGDPHIKALKDLKSRYEKRIKENE